MAKDPATLWYWNDWHGGTITLSRHLKGCYMDLLHAQFNNGPLSLEEIKTVLGSDFSAWDALRKKFSKNENGLFFNERMELEKVKRAKHSAKQKQNVLKRWGKTLDTYDGNTMVLPLENENESLNENDLNFLNTEKPKIFENNPRVPSQVSVFAYFSAKEYPKVEAEAFFNHYASQNWLSGNSVPIANWRLKAETWHKNQGVKINDSIGKRFTKFDHKQGFRGNDFGDLSNPAMLKKYNVIGAESP